MSIAKKLNKKILKLALPSILANITIPIIGMVDIAIAGHLHGEQLPATLIGAITIGSMLFDLIYFNFAFLRVGTGGITAQAFGRGDWKSAGNTLSMALCVSLISSIILILSQWIVVDLAFLFIKSSPEIKILASEYFYIRIWAAPAALCLMSFKGWYIGMQDTVSPMFISFMVVIVNFIASYFLSYGIGDFKGMGYIGIAIGTVISQYCGMLTAITILLAKYSKKYLKDYRLSHGLKAFYSKHTKEFFKTNSDLFVRSLGFLCIYMGFTTISARYGDTALASSAIIMKLMLFFSFFTDSFAFAAEALTGRYWGANNPTMVKKTTKYIFFWSAGIALFFIIFNSVFAIPLFEMMTSDKTIIDFSSNFIIWLIIVPIIGCPAFVWDGIFIGATASKELRNASIYSVIGFICSWFILSYLNNILFNPQEAYNIKAINLLLLAYTIHLGIRSIYQSYIYIRKKGKFKFLKI